MKNLFPIVRLAVCAAAERKSISWFSCVITTISLVGCTAVVARWDASKIRQEVMAYYNDEIMENLIRMKQGLPFVHVDITTVNAQVLSQMSGTVGSGETTTTTKTTKSMVGALGTVSRIIMDPFSFSVTPTHSDTLTMTAAPVIGPLTADDSEESTTDAASTEGESKQPSSSDDPSTGASPPPGFEESKRSVETKGLAADLKTTQEFTPKKPKARAKTTTIYAIYESFRCSIVDDKNVLVYNESRPRDNNVVPGTLKRYGTGYYYIFDDRPKHCNQAKYTKLCTTLFTQSRGKASPKSVEQRLHTLDVLQAQPPQRPP